MVHLERLTADNWRQVITLDIANDQRRFVRTPSVLYGVAEVQFHPTYTAYAIYDDEMIVGFAVYGHAPDDPAHWWIPLILIDRHHQGKGYGRAAMQQIIQLIQAEAPQCRQIALSYQPDNAAAEHLYLSLGFENTGETDNRGYLTARLNLKQAVG
jgi:diamine N-acetyltransferase